MQEDDSLKKGQGGVRRPKSDITTIMYTRDEGILVVVVEVGITRFERYYHSVHIEFDVPLQYARGNTNLTTG